MYRRKYYKDYLDSVSNKDLKEADKLAILDELLEPTYSDYEELPNVKKNRIVLDLVNRTNEDSFIDLFGLPSGSNLSQNISYGDLFLTKYCEVIIPVSDVTVAKSWRLNWLDSVGALQSATFSSDTISDFIFNLNQSSSDSFSYEQVGSDYKIYKIPIDTFVYFSGWQPPVGIDFGTPNLFTLSTSLGTSGKRVTETLNSQSYFGSGQGSTKNGFWLGHQSGQLTFHTYSSPSTVDTTRDTNALYGMANVTDLKYDSGSNQVILFNGQTPNGQVAFVNLDATNTLDTLINLPSDYGRGVGYYWQSERLTISAFQGISVLSILYGIDETKSIVHQGQPLNTSGTTNLALCQLKENMSEDESGNLWIGNANQLTAIAENGVFKFSNGDLSQASDEILYDTINGMPQLIYKPICQYLKGRIFVSGFNGSGTWIDVYDVNTKQLIRSNFYTGRALRSFSYVDRYGDFIAWSDTSSTDILVTDFDGQVVQEESTSGNGYHLYSLQGSGSENYILRLDAASTTLNTYAGAISGSSSQDNQGGKEDEFYTENEFTDIENLTDVVTYDFTCYEVVKGTGISVTDLIGGLSYEEIVNGLRTNAEPYLFKDMSVYSNSLEQANENISKTIRDINGTSSKHILVPTVLPDNKQDVVLNIPIDFPVNAISELTYKVKANQTVRVIINYITGSVSRVIDVLNSYIENNIPFSEEISRNIIGLSKREKDYINKAVNKYWSYKSNKNYKATFFDVNDLIGNPLSKEDYVRLNSNLIESKILNEKIDRVSTKDLSEPKIKSIVSRYLKKQDNNKLDHEYNYGLD
jgi:hypothetical protein